MARFTNREMCDYMADGIEKSAHECERDGIPEKAARLFKWAAEVRSKRDDPDDPDDAPKQLAADGVDMRAMQEQLMSNRFSISDIQRATCRHFKIERSQLLSVSTERRLSDPRHIAMALSRQGGRSWEQIGRAFNRDHTIPIYACRKIEKRLAAGCQSTLEAITAIKASLEMTK